MPVERLQVHQHRAAGVRHVGRVHAAVAAAGQVPEQPAVDRAEGQLARLGALARAGHVVEDPGDLRPREVGRERQPDALAQAVGALARPRARARARPVRVSCQTIALWSGSPGLAVPHDGRLALVGDADRGDVARPRSPAPASAPSITSRVRRQISRGSCSTQPARGMDLLVLALVDRRDAAVAVEQDQPRAGRALVDRRDVAAIARTLRAPAPAARAGCMVARSAASAAEPRDSPCARRLASRLGVRRDRRAGRSRARARARGARCAPRRRARRDRTGDADPRRARRATPTTPAGADHADDARRTAGGAVPDRRLPQPRQRRVPPRPAAARGRDRLRRRPRAGHGARS